MASETWQIAARKDDRHSRSSVFLKLNRPKTIANNLPKRPKVKQEQNRLHIVQSIFCHVPNDEGSRRNEFASTANTEDLKSVSRMRHTGSCQPDQLNLVQYWKKYFRTTWHSQWKTLRSHNWLTIPEIQQLYHLVCSFSSCSHAHSSDNKRVWHSDCINWEWIQQLGFQAKRS